MQKIQQQVLRRIGELEKPISSHLIEVEGCSSLEVAVAVNQLILERLIEAEFDGIYSEVVSYRIIGLLPAGNEALQSPPTTTNNGPWFCRLLLRLLATLGFRNDR